jgi:hypothetical protein
VEAYLSKCTAVGHVWELLSCSIGTCVCRIAWQIIGNPLALSNLVVQNGFRYNQASVPDRHRVTSPLLSLVHSWLHGVIRSGF